MASRRARIKCVANIPVRRKNDGQNTTESVNSEPVENGEHEVAGNTKTENLHEEIFVPNQEKPINSECTDDEKVNHIEENKDTNEGVTPKVNILEESSIKVINETGNISNLNIPTNADIENNNGKEIVQNNSKENVQPIIKPSRRWTSKPSVRIPTASRQARPSVICNTPTPTEKLEELAETPPIDELTDKVVENESEISKIKIINTTSETINAPEPNPTETESQKNPLSPSKSLNRTRIRPMPKLIRRNSVQGSASESEDDGRKSLGRIRNDSVCSTSSLTLEITHTKDSNTKTIQYNTIIQRKCRRSEQSRRMAEARRKFNLKFGSKVPDKKKLTMMDLIFYNPTTNPMPKSLPQAPEALKISTDTVTEETENAEELNINDDDENVPVPQVKVGPDGEIILDEQSLVIEQTGTKKGREQLANSQIVIDDLNTGYGVYKRPKRSKDWTTLDTLKFYRALHTVGTDFSLMQPIFPNRQRRELKLKFKKEERINRQLIDKALLNPLEFNVTELEKTLEEDKKLHGKRIKNICGKKGRNTRKTLAGEMIEESRPKYNIVKRIKHKRKLKDSYGLLNDGIKGMLSDSDDETIFNENAVPVKRSNRLAAKKVVRFSEDIVETEEEEEEEENNEMELAIDANTTICNDADVIEDMEESFVINTNEGGEQQQSLCVKATTSTEIPDVKPGSVMILSSLAPNGAPMYKVFMVTPGIEKQPVTLAPEIIETLNSNLGNANAITLDLPVINNSVGKNNVNIIENNVVIS